MIASISKAIIASISKIIIARISKTLAGKFYLVVFSKYNFEKRLWLEHVCEVCAWRVLLLRFYNTF